jgi:K+-transporting ATPase ATPase C chain
MITELVIAFRSVFVLWIITAILYPLVILIVGFAFPNQANGSLITNSQGQIIGSSLIGQTFTSEKYFWGRPSTTNYSEGEAASPTGVSGASNLAPSNLELSERIQQQVTQLHQADIEPTADLVYTSGSSLDPHISTEAALAQIPRIAKIRGLSADTLNDLIAENTDPRFLGIFGEPGVNVLKLNLALDTL